MQNSINGIDVIIGDDSDGHAELAESSLREIDIVKNLYRGRNDYETLALVRHACRRGGDAADVPLLILLDCGLSRVHGVDVLRTIKNDLRHSWIPVIMMTDADDSLQSEQCRLLGCEAYVAKWAVFLGLPCFVNRVRFLARRVNGIGSPGRFLDRSHRDRVGTLDRRFISTPSHRNHWCQQPNGKGVRDEFGSP